MNNIFGYIRETGRNKKERSASIDDQEDKIARYAQRKGLLVTSWVRDRDVSSTVPLKIRTNGAKLLEALKPEDIVICTEPGILFARPFEATQDIILLEGMGAKVHFVSIGGEVFPKHIKLILSFLSSMASEEVFAKIHSSDRTKALLKGEGKITGGRPPYGFKVDENGKSAFDPSKKEAINFMLKEFKEGRSFRWIGMALFTYFNESLSANAVQRAIERFKDNPQLLKLLE